MPVGVCVVVFICQPRDEPVMYSYPASCPLVAGIGSSPPGYKL